ncbi:MAG: hypothetical protein HY808_06515 [Nitrospirae bacterium]|nr:hypothetical protein [Nitrospirota bacterium]
MEAAETKKEDKESATGKQDTEYVWPDLVFKEYLAVVAVTALMLLWALMVNAPLRELANPGLTENPAKAPWYFLGLQELLVYFDPWMAGVVLPSLIITGLIAVPYIDTNTKGVGEYALSLRKFAVYNYLFGFIMWWVLIVIGTFLRGPNWNFYWPWESWEIHKEVEQALVFQPAWGPAFLGIYFLAGFVVPWLTSRYLREKGFLRYSIIMLHLLIMYFVPVKIVLRLVFNVRYVWAAPWFNI